MRVYYIEPACWPQMSKAREQHKLNIKLNSPKGVFQFVSLFIGTRPSMRTKLKAPGEDDIQIAPLPSPPINSHYQVPAIPNKRACAVHGGGRVDSTTTATTASTISRRTRTAAKVNVVEESSPATSSWSPGTRLVIYTGINEIGLV